MRCDECGFVYEDLAADALPAAIRSFAKRYRDDDPAAVAEALAANAERLAATVEAVPTDGWERVGIRRDEERSVLFTARRAVHEGSHHLLDVGRGMRAVRDQRKAGS